MSGPQGKGAWSVTVGTKGQIVIPKEAREMFDIHAGDSLLVLADLERGIAILPKDVFDALHTSMFGRMQPNKDIADAMQAAQFTGSKPEKED